MMGLFGSKFFFTHSLGGKFFSRISLPRVLFHVMFWFIRKELKYNCWKVPPSPPRLAQPLDGATDRMESEGCAPSDSEPKTPTKNDEDKELEVGLLCLHKKRNFCIESVIKKARLTFFFMTEEMFRYFFQ